MIGILITLIQTIFWLFSLVLIVDIVLSYFMSPYQPIRMAQDRIVQPVLNPIRRIVPPLGGLDFSPIVLLILLQLVEGLLVNILSRMG